MVFSGMRISNKYTLDINSSRSFIPNDSGIQCKNSPIKSVEKKIFNLSSDIHIIDKEVFNSI